MASDSQVKLYLHKAGIFNCEAGEFMFLLKSSAASYPVHFCSLPKYVEPSSQTLQPITLELRRRKIPKGGEVPSKRPRIEKNLCEYFLVFSSHGVCTCMFL